MSAIDSIERIRFTTSHPLAFSQRLVDAYANVPKLVNHLHLLYKSASDRILAAMNGIYALDIKQKLGAYVRLRADISISSDFIIGFPGETDEDFEATMNLIHDVGFDHSYSLFIVHAPARLLHNT